MNHSKVSLAMTWHTSNRKKQNKIEGWCKDFGLRLIHSSCFVGDVLPKERTKLELKIRNLLSGKKDKFAFIPICLSCGRDATISRDREPMEIKEAVKGYELV